MSCFVFVVLVGGWGFSCVGLFWLSAWFLVLGFGVVRCSCSCGSSARLCGGAGGGLRVVPGLGVDVVRPVSIDYRVLVGGWACWARLSRVWFAGVGLRPVLLRLVGWWGVGRVFFRSALSVSSGSGVGLRGLVGVRGVLGGVGLGWGFFSGFCCSARAGAGSCLVAGVGVGCGLFWFCLESLILAQDERWRRA